MLEIKDLYDLEHTIAKDYLKKFKYPWEALKGLKEYVVELGKSLDPNEYKEISKNVWAINAYVKSTNNAIENYILEADKKIKETDRITQENNELLVMTNKTVEEKNNTIKLLEEEISTLTETIIYIEYDN